MRSIVSLVEGHGEVAALPVLLRRLLAQWPDFYVEPGRPWRVPRDHLIKQGVLEDRLRAAVAYEPSCCAALVLLDADDACPAEMGPALLTRAQSAVPEVPVAVVIANREFETWFLGAKESLRGTRDIHAEALGPADPESIRGAKEELTRNMPSGRRYSETGDQAALAEAFDVAAAAASCPSFAKLLRDIERLVAEARAREQSTG